MNKPIDAKKLNLQEWLKIVLSENYNRVFPNNCFPTDEHLNSYIDSINSLSDIEVKNLIRRFLVKTGSFGIDVTTKKIIFNSKTNKEKEELIQRTEYFRRLLSNEPPWEGITWILDLIPENPDQALKGLNAYFAANCLYLPDNAINGVSDALALIRAKFIEYEYPQQVFLNMTPYEFENLTEQLYQAKGYRTKMTQASHDGGIDIIATRKTNSNTEKLLIQCKRYTKKITVKEVRELSGVLQDYPLKKKEKLNKAVLVCSSEFTRDALKESVNNYTIELIDYKEFSKQLNQFVGRYWIKKLDRYIIKPN